MGGAAQPTCPYRGRDLRGGIYEMSSSLLQRSSQRLIFVLRGQTADSLVRTTKAGFRYPINTYEERCR